MHVVNTNEILRCVIEPAVCQGIDERGADGQRLILDRIAQIQQRLRALCIRPCEADDQ